MGCLLNIVKCTVILYFLSLYTSFPSTLPVLLHFLPFLYFLPFISVYSVKLSIHFFVSFYPSCLLIVVSFHPFCPFSICFLSVLPHFLSFYILHILSCPLILPVFYPSCPTTLPVWLIYLPFYLSYPTILSLFYFCFQTENLDNLFILEKTKFVWVLL